MRILCSCILCFATVPFLSFVRNQRYGGPIRKCSVCCRIHSFRAALTGIHYFSHKACNIVRACLPKFDNTHDQCHANDSRTKGLTHLVAGTVFTMWFITFAKSI